MNKANIYETTGWVGKVVIISNGKKRTIYNRIMNNALNEIIKALYNPNANIELSHVAIGDDDSANVDTRETLFNEIYRVPVISKLKVGTGEIESRALLLDTEPPSLSGACTNKEVGFFCGSGSQDWNDGTGKDTGLMLSRIIISPAESKTNTEQISFTRSDEFVRG